MELRENWSARSSSVRAFQAPQGLGFVSTPHLRGAAQPAPAAIPVDPAAFPASDPRWALALRTAEQLEGNILTIEKRQRLLRLGVVLGLTLFDANLVIAIVQDQARRGYSPAQCAAAGAQELAMVPAPTAQVRPERLAMARRMLTAALVIAAVIGVEILLLWWVFK